MRHQHTENPARWQPGEAQDCALETGLNGDLSTGIDTKELSSAHPPCKPESAHRHTARGALLANATDLRLTLHRQGYRPVPADGKRPVLRNWSAVCATADEDTIAAWADRVPAASNTGLLCGKTVGSDIDVMDATHADHIEALAREMLGDTPLRRIGRAPKRLLVYRTETPFTKISTPKVRLPDGGTAQVEILATGQQFIAYGVHPDTGAPYRWTGGQHPLSLPASDLPAITADMAQRFVQRAGDYLAEVSGTAGAGASVAVEFPDTLDAPAPAPDSPTTPPAPPAASRRLLIGDNYADHSPAPLARVRGALAYVPNTNLPYDDWVRVGMALKHEFGDDALDLWEEWSAQYPGNDPDTTAAKWDSFKPDGRVSIATVFHMARQNGWHGGQCADPGADRDMIVIAVGELDRIAREAVAVLDKGGGIYQRGGVLVHVLRDSGKIEVATDDWLHLTLSERVAWRKQVKSKETGDWKLTPADAPRDIPRMIQAMRGSWPFRELVGVIHGPIMRPDGSLLDTPGYDPATGLLLHAKHGHWPDIPREPTRQQVQEALAALWAPFASFPYVDDVSRGVQLAALLTAVQRPLLETAPGFGWNAFRAGTGKSKAAKATAWLGGSEPAESPWSDNEEEQRKRLLATLLGGPPGMMIDNISGPVKSDSLCAVLTTSLWRDRVLGKSEEVSAPTRLLITLTGNNLRLAGDLTRRVLVATMDHGVEHPERLVFDFDPVARVRENWQTLRAAALTLLRGFVAAGRPAAGPGRIGSYEEWDALIRQCVCWIKAEALAPFAVEDPAEALARNYDHDPETQKLRAVLCGWYHCFGNRPTSVASAIKNAQGGLRQPGDDEADTQQDLLDVLDEIAGERRTINPRRLGRWIERNAGRIEGGLTFERAGQKQRAATWRVVQRGGDAPRP